MILSEPDISQPIQYERADCLNNMCVYRMVNRIVVVFDIFYFCADFMPEGSGSSRPGCDSHNTDDEDCYDDYNTADDDDYEGCGSGDDDSDTEQPYPHHSHGVSTGGGGGGDRHQINDHRVNGGADTHGGQLLLLPSIYIL